MKRKDKEKRIVRCGVCGCMIDIVFSWKHLDRKGRIPFQCKNCGSIVTVIKNEVIEND